MAKQFLMRGELRLKNARLVQAREQLGMTMSAFARLLHIHPSEYCSYETMRKYPSATRAEALATIVGCTVAELFPPELRDMSKGGVPRMAVEIPVSTKRLLGMARSQPLMLAADTVAPDEHVDKVQLGRVVMQAVACLSPLEARILKMRFGLEGEDERTLVEVGQQFSGLSQERVRQIEAQAIRKISRHPAVKKIRDDGGAQRFPLW